MSLRRMRLDCSAMRVRSSLVSGARCRAARLGQALAPPGSPGEPTTRAPAAPGSWRRRSRHATEKVERQRRSRRVEALAQIVERDAAAAARQRGVRGAARRSHSCRTRRGARPLTLPQRATSRAAPRATRRRVLTASRGADGSSSASRCAVPRRCDDGCTSRRQLARARRAPPAARRLAWLSSATPSAHRDARARLARHPSAQVPRSRRWPRRSSSASARVPASTRAGRRALECSQCAARARATRRMRRARRAATSPWRR